MRAKPLQIQVFHRGMLSAQGSLAMSAFPDMPLHLPTMVMQSNVVLLGLCNFWTTVLLSTNHGDLHFSSVMNGRDEAWMQMNTVYHLCPPLFIH